MNNEIKLEFERHENGQAGGFYRYRFDRTIFWFRQEPDGSIRTVNISDEKYPDIEFYADIAPDTLYPYQIRFRLPPVVICSYKDEDRFTLLVFS